MGALECYYTKLGGIECLVVSLLVMLREMNGFMWSQPGPIVSKFSICYFRAKVYEREIGEMVAYLKYLVYY